MNEELKWHYLVCFIFLEKKYYLFWKDDLFFISHENDCMLIRANKDSMLSVAKNYKLFVSDQEVYLIDMDDSFKLLKQMRRDRSLSEKSCRILLGCFNMLEDMAKSLAIPVGMQDIEENAVLDHVYDKIFWGNNLPAVTPEGKSYSPILLLNEIKIIRKYLRGLWCEIYNSQRGLNKGC